MKFFIGRGKIANAVIAFAMVLLIGPLQAKAELINIQFQAGVTPFSGAAADPALGGTWNQLTNSHGASSSLVNSSGVTTNTSISWTGDGMYRASNGFDTQPAGALMNSYLYSHGDQTITFSNLQGNTNYNLYIYTQGATDGTGRILTVGGTQINGGTQATSPMNPLASTFISGQNYLTITGKTDASGTLSFTYNATGTSGGNEKGFSEADINGLQLMQASGSVPEPSTCVLMGIGGLLVALRLKSRSLSLVGLK